MGIEGEYQISWGQWDSIPAGVRMAWVQTAGVLKAGRWLVESWAVGVPKAFLDKDSNISLQSFVPRNFCHYKLSYIYLFLISYELPPNPLKDPPVVTTLTMSLVKGNTEQAL